MTYKDETLAIHAGYTPEATTKAVAVLSIKQLRMHLITHNTVPTFSI